MGIKGNKERTMFAIDHIILLSAVLAILGVLASKLSPRFGVPVLVLFRGVGMLAGEDGIGRIFFDNADAAHAIGTFAARGTSAHCSCRGGNRYGRRTFFQIR